MAVTLEDTGLVECWQFIAVEWFSQDLTKPDNKPEPAIENGTHHRRDETFRVDGGGTTKDRTAAPALACVRNLVNGIYELERAKRRTRVDTLASWCQQQTFTTVWKILKR